MRTSVVKNIISQYIHNGSSVHGCFLDESKAFDLVDHGILFQKLVDRGLPLAVVWFLSCWYCSQQCVFVGINCCLILSLSNGVRQGGVLFQF